MMPARIILIETIMMISTMSMTIDDATKIEQSKRMIIIMMNAMES